MQRRKSQQKPYKKELSIEAANKIMLRVGMAAIKKTPARRTSRNGRFRANLTTRRRDARQRVEWTKFYQTNEKTLLTAYISPSLFKVSFTFRNTNENLTKLSFSTVVFLRTKTFLGLFLPSLQPPLVAHYDATARIWTRYDFFSIETPRTLMGSTPTEQKTWRRGVTGAKEAISVLISDWLDFWVYFDICPVFCVQIWYLLLGYYFISV